MRSIIVAFPDIIHANKIRDVLLQSGYTVRGTATSGSMTLVQVTSNPGGGLVICGPLFPDMSAGHIQTLLPEDYDMLVLASSGAMNIGYEPRDGLYTLALPLRSKDLVASVQMLLDTRQMTSNIMMSEMRRTESPVKEAPLPKRSPEDQRIIERAKALLMNRNQMSEQEAHRFLQKKSMDNGWKLIDMAKAVLKSQDA